MNPSRPDAKDKIRHLCAFWQHFTLHKRACDRSGKPLVSVFGPDCPYPVWKREDWLEDNKRPSASYNASKPFFEQLFKLFAQCPIPHMTGAGSENCEYCYSQL